MRSVVAALVLVSMLGISGCTTQAAPTQVSDSSRATIPFEATASADGVDLTLALSPADGVANEYDITYTVSVPGTDPVEVRSANGSVVDIELNPMGGGAAAFSSLQLDQEAIASQPDGFTPPLSETLSEGSSSSSTYRVKLEPGVYELTAKTFGPVVTLDSQEIEVR